MRWFQPVNHSKLVKIIPDNRHYNTGAALFFVMLVSSLACHAAAPIIEQKELLQKNETGSAVLIIDVRTRGEYQSGHVP